MKKLLRFIYDRLHHLFTFGIRAYFILWNMFKFYIHGVEYGKKLRVYDKIYLNMAKGARIKIGNNFAFTSGSGINAFCRNILGMIKVYHDATLLIGDNTGISSAAIRVHEKITIGNYVKIGGDCLIFDSDCHSLDYEIRAGFKIDSNTGRPVPDCESAATAPVIIEDHVLIGARSIILKGVTIGARSIIGAGSVVTKSIPADCIAAGNPCRVIKYINKP